MTTADDYAAFLTARYDEIEKAAPNELDAIQARATKHGIQHRATSADHDAQVVHALATLATPFRDHPDHPENR